MDHLFGAFIQLMLTHFTNDVLLVGDSIFFYPCFVKGTVLNSMVAIWIKFDGRLNTV